MKKYLSLVLAAVLMLALAIPALAADTLPKTADTDVTAGYTAPNLVNGGTVYSVTIAWEPDGSNNLAYAGKNATYTWNDTTLKYEEDVTDEAGWTGSAGYTITVTNKSNAAVTAKATATNTYKLDLTAPAETPVEIRSAAIDSDSQEIDYTNTDAQGVEQTADFEITYDAADTADDPEDTQATTITVGKITVTVAAA